MATKKNHVWFSSSQSWLVKFFHSHPHYTSNWSIVSWDWSPAAHFPFVFILQFVVIKLRVSLMTVGCHEQTHRTLRFSFYSIFFAVWAWYSAVVEEDSILPFWRCTSAWWCRCFAACAPHGPCSPAFWPYKSWPASALRWRLPPGASALCPCCQSQHYVSGQSLVASGSPTWQKWKQMKTLTLLVHLKAFC